MLIFIIKETVENDKLNRTKPMTQKIKRLTMNDLNRMVENTVNKVIVESNYDSEIKIAQKELMKMGSYLSSVGMRLQDTPYRGQYQRIYDEVVNLNNALIKHIRGEK